MNAEELLIYLKECVDSLKDDNIETHILPTTGNPTEQQYNVSFIVMEKIEAGQVPRFTVNVKDRLKPKPDKLIHYGKNQSRT